MGAGGDGDVGRGELGAEKIKKKRNQSWVCGTELDPAGMEQQERSDGK